MSIRMLEDAIAAVRDTDSFSALTNTLSSYSLATLPAHTLLAIANAAQTYRSKAIGQACLEHVFSKPIPTPEFKSQALRIRAALAADSPHAKDSDISKALTDVLESIGAASDDPNKAKVTELILQSSLAYLNVVRPWLQTGSWHKLLPSINTVAKALGDSHPPHWRAKVLLFQAKALSDTGKASERQQALELGAKLIAKVPEEEAHRLVSLSLQLGLDMSSKESKLPVILTAAATAQAAATSQDGEKARAALQSAFDNVFALRGVGNETDMSRVDWTDADTAPRHKGLSVLVLIGRAALAIGDRTLAHRCGSHVHTSTDAGQAAVDAEMLLCEIAIKDIDLSDAVFSKEQLKLRVQTIDRVHAAVRQARSASSHGLVQVGCTLIWNFCLPLLQPNLRKYARKGLIAAVENLDGIDSTLHSLQCNIHAELAKIAIDDLLLPQAEMHLARVDALDVEGTYAPKLAFLRKQLGALKCDGNVKLAASSEDQALVFITQAAETEDKVIQRAYLIKAGILVNPALFGTDFLSYVEVNAEAYSVVERAASVLSINKVIDSSTCVFSSEIIRELARMARKLSIWDIARAASLQALKVLGSPPSQAVEKLLTQCELRFIFVDATVKLLTTFDVQPGQFLALSAGASSEETQLVNQFAQGLTADIMTGLLEAAKTGGSIAQPWIVTNACIGLWNSISSLVTDSKIQSLVDYLAKFYSTVEPLVTEHKIVHARLALGRIAIALTNGICFKNKLAADVDEPTPKKDAKGAGKGNDLKTTGLSDAVIVAQNAISLIGDHSFDDASFALRAYVWITKVAGAKCTEPADANPSLRFLYQLELLDQGLSSDIATLSQSLQSLEDEKIASKRSGSHEASGKSLNRVQFIKAWTRIATCASNAKQGALLFKAATHALELHRARKPGSHISAEEAECCFTSQVLLGSYHDSRAAAVDDLSDCNKIRSLALSCFAEAAKFAAGSFSPASLLTECARFSWNVAVTMSDMAQLSDPLDTLLKNLTAPSRTKAKVQLVPPELLLSLYELLFESYAVQALWTLGLQAVDQAQTVIPRGLDAILWSHRAVFKSKLGQDVTRDMLKLKNNDALTQAKGWIAMSRVENKPSSQLACLQNAITAIESSHEHVDILVDCLIDVGKWHYSNQSPAVHALDALSSAASKLCSVESPSFRQLEALTRIYTIMAQCSGAQRSSRLEYTVVALSFVSRIWTKLMSLSMPVVVPDDGASSKRKSVSASILPPPTPVLPESFADWLQVSIDTTALEALQLQGSDEIAKVHEFLHCLRVLGDIVSSQHLFSNNIRVFRLLQTYTSKGSSFASNPLFVDSSLALLHLAYQLDLASEAQSIAAMCAVVSPTVDEYSSMREKALMESRSSVQLSVSPLSAVSPPSDIEVWSRIAERLLCINRVSEAVDMIAELRLIAQSSKEHPALPRLSLLSALVSLLKQDAELSLESILSLKVRSTDIRLALRALEAWCSIVVQREVQVFTQTKVWRECDLLLKGGSAFASMCDALAKQYVNASRDIVVVKGLAQARCVEAELELLNHQHGSAWVSSHLQAAASMVEDAVNSLRPSADDVDMALVLQISSKSQQMHSRLFLDARQFHLLRARALLVDAHEKLLSALDTEACYGQQRGCTSPVLISTVQACCELADLELNLCQELYIVAEGEINLAKQGKTAVVMRDFLKDEEEEARAENVEWNDTINCSGQNALATIHQALTLSAPCARLKPDCLLMLGKCLVKSVNFLRQQFSPYDSGVHWADMESSINALSLKSDAYLQLTELATAKLAEAAQQAIASHDMKIAQSAFAELAELTGVWDATATANALLAHQSARASQFLLRVLLESLPSGSLSSEKTLCLQYLAAKQHPLSVPPPQHVQKYIQSSFAWSRMRVAYDAVGFAQSALSDVIILSLQMHNGFIYGAALNSKSNLPVSVSRTPFQGSQLFEVKHALREAELFIGRAGAQTASLELKTRPVESFSIETETTEAVGGEDSIAVEVDARLKSIARQLSELLMPAIDPLMATLDGETIEQQKLLLLLDEDLLSLPVEMLPCFASPRFSSISKDFSISVFQHRLSVRTQAPLEPEATRATEAKSKAPKAKAPAKGAETLPILSVDASKTLFIVDPRSDYRGAANLSPEAVFSETMHGVLNRKQWTGIVGNGFERTPTELQLALLQASTVIHYGPGRWHAVLPPASVASLNLSSCNVGIFLQMLANEHAGVTQTSRDAKKSASDLSLENNVTTAALYTLRGLGSVMMTNWPSAPADSKGLLSRMSCFFATENHMLLGDAARTLVCGVPIRSQSAAATSAVDEKHKSPVKSPKKPLEAKSESGRQGMATRYTESEDERHPPPISMALRYNLTLFGLPTVSFQPPNPV